MKEIFFAWCQKRNKKIGPETYNENQAWDIADEHYEKTGHLTTVMSIISRSTTSSKLQRRVSNQMNYRSNWTSDEQSIIKKLTDRKQKDDLPLIIEERISNTYEIIEIQR